MPLPERKPKMADGERVLCYHGPLLYEAKILKTMVKEKVIKYFVHYAGWNVKWDEWVAESRVLKYNDEGLKKQKDLKQQYIATKKPRRKDLKEEKKEDGPPPSKRRKGRVAAASDKEPTYVQRVDVKIMIPHDLRRFLLDDCDFVTRQKQLVPLPKPPELTVKGICDSYIKYQCEQLGYTVRESTLTEVTSGINEYFNVMLGSQLLYKFERTQYADVLKEYPEKDLCEVYGCEHLLRLFVKLGTVLSYSNLDEASMEFVSSHIHDLLEYIDKNSEDLFAAEYETAPPDYLRRSSV